MRHKFSTVKKETIEYKTYECLNCRCEKIVGKAKFSGTQYQRSGQITDHSPACTDMSRRSTQTID